MHKDTTLTIRVEGSLKERLKAVAKQLNRSKSHIAGEAIAEFVAVQEWQIARTQAALRAMDAGQGSAHEDVVGWVESWGAERELARPGPVKRGA